MTLHAILTRCSYCGGVIAVNQRKMTHGFRIELNDIHNIPRTNVVCNESEMPADTHWNRENKLYTRGVS
jgi:hypothetical protein